MSKKFRIVLAEQDHVAIFSHEVAAVLRAMGHPEALVTDMSQVSDFCLNGKRLANVRARLGVRISAHDYVWEIAKRLREKATKACLGKKSVKKERR